VTERNRLAEAADGVDPVRELVLRFGVRGRQVQELVGMLASRRWTHESLVAASGLSRRTVDDVLAALGPDVERAGQEFWVRAERTMAYRGEFPSPEAGASEAKAPKTGAPAARIPAAQDVPQSVRQEIARLIEGAPRPREELDHVAATAETLVRRARWLAGIAPGAELRLLCVGDHDLTSIAACLVSPRVRAAVADVDENLLAYIGEQASRLGLPVRPCYADLRFGLPPELHQWADIAFTDPPYTPHGVALFAERGLEGLANREFGTVAVAYGFGEQAPALGLAVQQSLAGLGLVFEAIYPDFNQYHGAQAIGSRSDLYVCRPTGQTWKRLSRGGPGGTGPRLSIYSRGPRATEARDEPLGPDTEKALTESATRAGTLPLTAVAGAGWSITSQTPKVQLATLMQRGLPAHRGGRAGVAVNLDADPGPWLLRVLLAVNARQVAALVPNGHADLASQAGQQDLRRLLAAKYALRFRRSFPASRQAIAEATAVDSGELDPAAYLQRYLLDRAGSKLRGAWRDGLIATAQRFAWAPLSKNEARALVAKAAPDISGEARIMDLPRAGIARLLDDVAASVAFRDA
jgi:N4-bis(aminopropyl)spermidine synthase